jgi:hypothetical protein
MERHRSWRLEGLYVKAESMRPTLRQWAARAIVADWRRQEEGSGRRKGKKEVKKSKNFTYPQ